MKKTVILSALLLAALSVLQAAELKLTENGTTVYAVSAPAKASKIEKEAVADFVEIMKKISGADFGSTDGKSRFIYVGKVPACDKKVLQEGERRITSHNGDIYLYGEGRRGNTNAIYDFLREYLGCRWFTPYGDEKIPVQKNIVLKDLKYSCVPSFPTPMTATRVAFNSKTRDFARRNNLAERDEYNTGGSHGSHAGHGVIPSGLVPVGSKKQNIAGPYPCLKDKAYFKTHPEFFTMDQNGKRNPWKHLCYSNKDMRDEFAKNVEIILKDFGYDGGTTLFSIGQDDKGGKFCYCKDCVALEQEYEHPAGPYYDFLYDICGRFEKKYPELKFLFLAYRDDQTLLPAKKMAVLPRNLMPSYAPIGVDFSKPFSHPNNKVEYDTFKIWAKTAPRLYWWSYPTPYPRPLVGYPLIANVNRIVENFRFAHANKVWMVYSQYGGGTYVNFAFNDMRRYLLQELCRDINIDEKAVMKEFYEATVGPAAPLMLKFIAELEKEEAAMPAFITWNSDILRVTYLTPKNLLHWTRLFRQMEKLVKDNPRQLLNVRRARVFLDESIIARWPYMSPEEQNRIGNLEKIIARATRAAKADANQLLNDANTSASKQKSQIRSRMNYFLAGMDVYAAAARGGKELPAELNAKGKLYRIIPNRNRHPLIKDKDAAFGLCTIGKIPSDKSIWMGVRTFDKTRNPSWLTQQLPKPVNMKRLRKEGRVDGKYHYIHLGASTLSRICVMNIANIYGQSWFELSHLFEPATPNRLFDFYVQIAVDPKKKQVKLGELVVIPLNKKAKSKDIKTVKDDSLDAYV